MNLRTANHNHKRRVMKCAKVDALAYDMERIARLDWAGRLDKRANSSFVRRLRSRDKARRREMDNGK